MEKNYAKGLREVTTKSHISSKLSRLHNISTEIIQSDSIQDNPINGYQH